MRTIISNLAFDLGASSGRLILSSFNDSKITLKELHRFPNEPVRINGRFYWDFYRLFHEMKTGLREAAKLNIPIAGIGIDTWGVDYGLLDRDDNIIGVPINYRDSRTDKAIEDVAKIVPLSEIYDSTGIQFLNFNTLFQLFADRQMRPLVFENAETMLFMPDLLNYFLTGEKYCEYTVASTSQMLNAKSRDWDYGLLDKVEIPMSLLPEMVQPGVLIGRLNSEIQEETGLSATPVIAVGSHDTASAVAGTPFHDAKSAFLSCGTWSLLGIELDEPIISDLSFKYNFTNEGGVENKIRFLKNINGLWILQQFRKNWNEANKENQISFPDIISAARSAENKKFIIDPSDPSFMAPINMIDAIVQYCKNKRQGEPQGVGEIASAIYNGITGEYKATVKMLEEILGYKITAINMIGGGIQDEYLCQMTANATRRGVVAGPIEGSVLGNVVMQLAGLGHIKGLEEGREIIKNSFEQKTYKPQ